MKLSKQNVLLKLQKVKKSLFLNGIDKFTIDSKNVLQNNHGVVSISFFYGT